MAITSTNAELVSKILGGEFVAGVQDEVYASRDHEGVEYGIFAFPLFDFAGRQIGVIGGGQFRDLLQRQARPGLRHRQLGHGVWRQRLSQRSLWRRGQLQRARLRRGQVEGG